MNSKKTYKNEWKKYKRMVDANYDNIEEVWLQDFNYFITCMGPSPPGSSIGRKDSNLPYGPDNCFWEEVARKPPKKVKRHGLSGTRVHKEWVKVKRHHNVYKPWLDDIQNFIDDMGTPKDNESIRMKKPIGFHPGNCFWKPVIENLYQYYNVTKTIEEWAELSGIDSVVLNRRLKWKWELEEALYAPEEFKTKIDWGKLSTLCRIYDLSFTGTKFMILHHKTPLKELFPKLSPNDAHTFILVEQKLKEQGL